ncbi:MAG TPA: hypothetical protein VMM54_03000 [Nitrospirota bacterium]|nr:hypothetical protein [Nitrospirota bacterium]
MSTKLVHKTYIISFCLLFAIAFAANEAHARCAFVGGSTGVISFGIIDPSTSPGPVLGTVTTQVNFTCNNNRAFTVTATPASGWTLTGPGSMAYTPGFIASGTGHGNGTPIALLTNTSQILQSNYQDAPTGSYHNSSAVTLTINCPLCTAPKTITATIPATTGVTASIANTCSSAASGSMSFNIDPSGLGTLTPNTTANGTSPSVKCTKNTGHAVACSSANGNKLTIGNDGVTDPIAYTITSCPASVTGSGFSTAASIPVGISILQTAYQNAKAGAHSDTITVTVTY